MVRYFTGLVLTLVLITGCGSSNDFAAGPPHTQQNQVVATPNLFVQGPTVTGQVTVKNADGQVIAEAPAIAGLASLTVPEGSLLPSESVSAQATASSLLVTFVVDEGEHLGAGDGSGTFYAEVPEPRIGDTVGIDAVSSLIALYHQAHPDLTFEQASLKVFDYLGLDEDTNPEHLFDDTDFESGLFFAEAQASGGIDALLQKLIVEVDGPSASGVRFLQANVAVPGIVDIVAKKLADSALSYFEGQVEGKVVGWLEGLIGIEGGPSISDVLLAIDGLRADIERLSIQISQQANIQAYNERDLVLVKERSDANVDSRTLLEWADPTNQTPPSEAQIAAKMESIRNRYNSTLDTANTLELPDIGATGTVRPGLIGLYLNAAVPRLYGAVQKDKATYHLRRSLDFQQTVLNLQVEALHYVRPSLLLDAERAIDDYFSNAKSQRQQYPLAFDEEKVILDRENNRLWSRKPVVLQDARALNYFLARYTLDSAAPGSWRVPTADEYDSILFATGGTGIDQHTEIRMKDAGFLPINGSSTLGDWRVGTFDWKVLTWPIRFDNSGIVATFVHSSNNRRSTEILNGLDLRTGGFTGPRGDFVFYLMRDMPTITSISISENARTSYTVSYKAKASLSDGSQRDVTELVKWSVKNPASGTVVSHSVARISNVAESDGVLTYRVSGSPAMTVTAEYNQEQASVTAPVLSFAEPAVTGLLISPLRYHVPADGYTAAGGTFQLAFRARSVRANGALKDVDTEVTWTSSDSSVTVSASGLVTATRPSQRKTVTITARLGAVSQISRLVLDP